MKIAYMPDTHFGIYDQPEITTPDDVADAMEQCLMEAEIAERAGFDGIWVPERHQRPETYWPNTVTYLAALAARTKRVELIPTVMQPTYHHPVHLAEQLACIDNLSRGRLTFGAGVGYHRDYFRQYGVPFEKRGKRFEETLEVLNGAWTEDEFNYAGEFYQYEGVRLYPKPYQKPRPKIWIGAFAPKALERALDWDGWVTWFPPSFEEIRVLTDQMREKADKLGKKNWQVAFGIEGWIGDGPNIKAQRDRWIREQHFYVKHGLAPEAALSQSALDNMENCALCIGGKQQWIDRLGEFKEKINPDWVCIRTRTPRPETGDYPSLGEFTEVVERLGEMLPEARWWDNDSASSA
ncbi:MAG TPA: LLM class flavin-dependent oxidoreductase [Sneathiellales bacterium]|nr:LLM class flavin-dependent oxidoreductase [Sneathiellales bacterium]